MKDKINIFNIEANYHFFASLLAFLEENFAQKLDSLQLILPNRRSCRELKLLFLKKSKTQKIPKLKAIADLSYEDFFQFLPDEEVKRTIEELTKAKVLDELDYLFFLTEKIQKQAVFGNLDFNQAFKSAGALKELFDEIEQEEIDLNQIALVDDSNLAGHRQVTLEFLSEFAIYTKNILLKENIFTRASYQNLVVKRFIEALENHQLKSPIIIAGSTGSVAFSKKLIGAISKQEHGFVVLHNFKNPRELPQENHPQFLLKRLFDSLENKNLQNLRSETLKISPQSCTDFLDLMMLPHQEASKWQNAKIENIAPDLEKNFLLIEAKNDIEEAKLIAGILQKNQSKKSVVIINDKNFANLLKLELERLNLDFNDSRSQRIFNSKLINFLILLIEISKKDFNSHSLLALFKHSLFAQDTEIIKDFELNILRKSRTKKGLEGLKEAAKDNLFVRKFLANFSAEINIKSLIKITENLTKKTWLELVNNEEAGEEIFKVFELLKKQNYHIDSLESFKAILAQISYFSKSDALSNIQILSPIEARLLNFDLLILSSLNEGNFPKISGENWLGKKIKKDLGIDKDLQKVGQNAYDFCNYLSNPKIVLSRAKSRNGVDLLESPFLTKFKTLAKKLDVNLNFGEEFFNYLNRENNVAELEISETCPIPPLAVRAQKFSITEISKLIANPYFIYCKKILQLNELDKIDYEAGNREFGSFVHKALEEYIKNPNNVNFAEIFEEFFIAKNDKLTWWPKFENIFANFLDLNEEFKDCKNLVEENVEMRLNNIFLRGKIDRIILGENAAIFDYKTGVIPDKKSVESGLEPQLTIAALMLLEKQIEISELNYWKLSGTGEGKIEKISDNKEITNLLIMAAKQGLEKLFSYFDDEKNGYIARDNLNFDEYKNLARIND